MKVLTTPSQDGNGFAVDSADLVNTISKLGKIEWKGYDIFEEVCSRICRFTARAIEEGRRSADATHCAHCPVTRMHDLIYRGGSKNELDGNRL